MSEEKINDLKAINQNTGAVVNPLGCGNSPTKNVFSLGYSQYGQCGYYERQIRNTLSVDLNGVGVGSSSSFTFLEGYEPSYIIPNASIVPGKFHTLEALTIIGTNFGLDGANESVEFGAAQFPSNANNTELLTVGSTTFSIQYVASTKTFNITENGGGNFPITDANALLASMVYYNVEDPITVGDRYFAFTASDQNFTSTTSIATVSVQLVPNVPPVITIQPNLSYTEGDSIVVLDDTCIVSDSDGTDISQITIECANILDGDSEVLEIGGVICLLGADSSNVGSVGGISVLIEYTVSNGIFVITKDISGNLTVAQAQTLLRSVAYANTSSELTEGTRIFTITVNDGEDESAPDSINVSVAAVTPINNPPVVDLNNVVAGINITQIFIDGDPTTSLCPNATISDLDNDNPVSMTIVGSSFTADDEIVKLGDAGTEFPIGSNLTTTVSASGITYNVAYTTSNKTWQITGTATLAQWQALLRTLKYVNDSSPVTTGERTLSISVNDGTDSSTPALLNILVEDALVGTAISINVLDFDWTQEDGDIYISDDAIVSSDTGIVTELTISLSGFVDDEYEVISIADRIFLANETRTSYGWIRGVRYDLSYNGTTKILTAIPAVANLSTEIVCQDLIRSLRYWRLGKGLTPGTRAFEFIINDGSTTSTPVTVTVNEKVKLTIRTTDYLGDPVSGATVTLKDSLNNTLATGSSDVSGLFTATIDENGTGYVLTVTKGGKQNYSTTRTITGDQVITCPLFTNAVTVDLAWLADTANLCSVSQTTGPYKLTAVDTLYTLTTDVTSDQIAFVARTQCGINTNGHTITYSNAPFISLTNEGFETGDLTGWDTTGAPNAQIIANTDLGTSGPYLFGNYACGFLSFSGSQTIVSDPIAIPEANKTYSATVWYQGGGSGKSVRIQVYDDVTNTLLAGYTNTVQGGAAYTYFTPTTTNDIRVEVTCTCASTGSLRIDDVRVRYAYTPAIMCTPSPSRLPSWVQAYNGTGTRYFTIYDSLGTGSIIQGTAKAAYSPVIYGYTTSGQVIVDNLSINFESDDAQCLFAQYGGGDYTFTNNTVTCGGYSQHIINRQANVGVVSLSSGTASNYWIENNIINDAPQLCVVLSDSGIDTAHRVYNNYFTAKTKVTNAYAVSLSAGEQADVRYNIVNHGDGYSGRGIMLDNILGAGAVNSRVEYNHLQVRERPNYEYSWNGLEATAIRFREFSQPQLNNYVRCNYAYSYTDASHVHQAIGLKPSLGSSLESTGCKLNDNIAIAIVDTVSTNYEASAFEFANNRGNAYDVVGIYRNRFESNCNAMTLCGVDTGGKDLLLGRLRYTELIKSMAGSARTYLSINADANSNNEAITGFSLVDTCVTAGANLLDYDISGSGLKDIAYEWTATADVASGGTSTTVVVEDDSSVEVYNAACNTNGDALDIVLRGIWIQQLTSSSSAITETVEGNYTATCSQVGQTDGTAIITASKPLYIPMTFNTNYVPPALSSVAIQEVTRGDTGYTLTLTNTGSAADLTYVSSGALPDDLTISGLVISGDIAADAILGAQTVTITAQNQYGEGSVDIDYQVSDGGSPTYVTHTTASNTSGTSLAVNTPAGGQAGDVYWAFVSSAVTSGVTPPAGWTLQSTVTNNIDPQYRIRLYTRPYNGSEAADYTWSFGAATGIAIINILIRGGADPGVTAPTITTLAENYASPLNFASVTPSVNSSLVIRCGGTKRNRTITNPTANGHTNIGGVNGTSSVHLHAMYRIEDAAASGQLSFNLSNTGERNSMTVAIPPA